MLFLRFLLLLLPFKMVCAATWQEALQEKIAKGEKPEWMMQQIRADLEPYYKSGISKSDLDAIMQLSPFRLLRFRVVDGKVYVPSERNNLEITRRYVTAIEQLAKLTPLPDVDFILHLLDAFYHDWYCFACRGPLFTYAKKPEHKGIILIPDFEAVGGEYIDLIKQVKQGNCESPWNRKIEKAFWRGATSGYYPHQEYEFKDLDINPIKIRPNWKEQAYNLNSDQPAYMTLDTFQIFPRVQLVALSIKESSYVDARFSSLIFLDYKLENLFYQLHYVGKPASIAEHLEYKYQILADGFSCAYSRAVWQLFANTVIFKQAAPDIQWYYHELQPYVHYIPVAEDFSDLIEKIDWAKQHDEKAQQITHNANQFAQTHLKHEDIMLYLYLLLTEYAKLQNF